ncbi:MAG TPA: YezD family protein [Planctomycetaceae bacterium]|nr:YezD family protein [Planctomycetaceae bacterium]
MNVSKPETTVVSIQNAGSVLTEPVLAALTEALRGIRYGTVTVIVQDGRVIQIDRTERRRLKSASDS